MSIQSRSCRKTASLVVWDRPVRLFHWLAAFLVLAAWLTERFNWMDLHVVLGEALLAIVIFRLAWGVVGSDTARFARFVASPRAAFAHLRHALRREPDRQIGHNAAGGWMVLLLLALLLAETLTGIVTNNDVADEGPLTERLPAWALNLISDLHLWLWDALVAAIALHVAAIAFYAVVKQQDLVRPMVTGRKAIAGEAPRIAHLSRAAVVLGGSAVVAALLASFI